MSNIFIKQIESLLDETDLIAALANLSSAFNQYLDDINWVGFYLLKDNELVLGPFQGKVACSHIKLNQGVCGKCASDKKALIVENVHTFKGHIACDSASNSEMVIPIIKNNKFLALIDIDSTSFNRFTKDDLATFEVIAVLIADKLF